jgi:GNAT superfamily N-acetyltransferase
MLSHTSTTTYDPKKLVLTDNKEFRNEAAVLLYHANKWSSAQKPHQLVAALRNSHTLILAFYNNQLVGLANAISDGHLVVYYPHLLIHPDFQGKGIGSRIMEKMDEKYHNFHQQMLVADGRAIEFYQKCGFNTASQTQSMWKYEGTEH